MNKPYTQRIYALGLLTLLYAGSCAKSYDDSELRGSIGKVEQRAVALEALMAQANTKLQALQAMAQAMAGQDYLESYSQDNAGNLILKFAKAGEITITQGTQGADGVAPSITIAKAEDSKYYWQVGGSWLLNAEGQKVSALPEEGKTPRLKIEGGMWYISYDGGATWEPRSLGQAVGNAGSAASATATPDLISQIDTSSAQPVLKITLSSGEILEIPRERQDITIEVVGEVPEIVGYGYNDAGIATQPLKLRISYPKEQRLRILSPTSGAIRTGKRDEQVTETSDGRIVKEWSLELQLSNSRLPAEPSPDLILGTLSLEVHTDTGNWEDKELLKMKVIPIKKYRRLQFSYFSSSIFVTMSPLGETISIPLLLGADTPLYITSSGSPEFTWERQGDNLLVTVPPNTNLGGARGFGFSIYPSETMRNIPSMRNISIRQGSLNRRVGDNIEVVLGNGQPIPLPSLIGQFKLKGLTTSQDLLNLGSALSGVTNVQWLDLSEMPLEALTREFVQLFRSVKVDEAFFPETVRAIGERAFEGNNMLELRLPPKLEMIAGMAFKDFQIEGSIAGHSRLVLPHSVTALGQAAFAGSKIRTVALSDGLTELSPELFVNSELNTVILPNNPRFSKIGDNAFLNCRELEYVFCLHQTPPALGSRAFANVGARARIYIPAGSKARYLASDWAKYFKPSAFVEEARNLNVQDIIYAR